MKYKILDAILDAHEAEKIAQDCGLTSEQESAEHWFNEIYHESTWSVDQIPKYNQFIKKIESGNLYYDYGANYYFLVKISDQINTVPEIHNLTEFPKYISESRHPKYESFFNAMILVSVHDGKATYWRHGGCYSATAEFKDGKIMLTIRNLPAKEFFECSEKEWKDSNGEYACDQYNWKFFDINEHPKF